MRPRLTASLERHRSWLVPSVIAVVTVLAFVPALGNGFVSWDDQKNFLDNPHYRGLGLEQLRWMWNTFHLGHYVPLSWMSLGADYLLWGMNPAGYHATNIVLHAVNAVLVFFLARRLFALSGNKPTNDFASALSALLFAVHPLRVESVAWITERRDMLSLLFFLLSILAYLRAVERERIWNRWYAVSIAMFAFALLSKATVMTLPAVLLLLNIYPLRRHSYRRILIELAPFAVLSAAFIGLSIVALAPPEQLPLGAKLAVSAYSLQFYLAKTLVPVGLSPMYEMPQVVDPLEARFVVALIVCSGLAIGLWVVRRRFPAAVAAVIGFVIISAPMLGFVQNGLQIAADRYTYHAAPALAMLAGAMLFSRRVPIATRGILGSAAVLILGAATWTQTYVWHDSETLWTRVLALDPNSSVAHSAMASIRYKQNRIDEGFEHSKRAVELAPNYAQARNDLGVGLAHQGRIADAVEQYRKSIALDTTYDEAYNNLGVVLSRTGNIEDAVVQFRLALAYNPDYADAHVNWGNALVRAGRPADAVAHYQAALVLEPHDADARLNWGVALAQQNRFAEAADQFRAALAIDPGHAEARTYLMMAEQRLAGP